MDINKIMVDVEKTIGENLLLIEQRPSFSYQDGIRGTQDGIKVICLSEKAGYEKIAIKLLGIMSLPFDFKGTPIKVEFEELQGKLWQDWSAKGEIKLSASATGIKLLDRKRINLNE